MKILRHNLVVILLCLPGAPLLAQTVAKVVPLRSRIELKAGQTDTIRFQYFDQKHRELEAAKVKPRFETLDSAIVTIDSSSGALLARGAGSTQVRVKVRVPTGHRFGFTQVSVEAAPPPVPAAPALPPGRLQLETSKVRLVPGEAAGIAAHVIQADGRRAPDSQLFFRVINRGIATVDALTGRVTGVSPGMTEVEVGAPGIDPGIVEVNVSSDTLGLSADSLFLLVGLPDTVRLTVPSQGNRPYEGAVAWESSNENVIRAEGNGVLVPVTAGVAEVVVKASGFARPVWVHVYDIGTARSSMPTDSLISLARGARTEFTIRALSPDAAAAVLYRVPAAWKVSDSTIISYDTDTGILTAVGVGRATLTARPRLKGMERLRTWNIEVVGGSLVPENPVVGLRVGMKTSVNAVFVDSTGRRTGRPMAVEWRDANSTVARTTSASQLEAIGLGRAVVSGRMPWGDSVQVTVLGLSDFLFSMRSRSGSTGIYGLQQRGRGQPLELVVGKGSTVEAEGTVSPDRTRMVYSSTRGTKEPQLWIADADGANAVPLTTGPARNEHPIWSRDGQWIIFSSLRSGKPRIFAIRPDKTGLQALTDSGATAQYPALSPDGTLLAYETLRNEQYDVVGIHVDSTMNRISRTEEPLLVSQDDERFPRYFPNGDLGFIRQERQGKRLRSLYRKVAGTSLTPVLTPPELYIRDFAISPDGQQVLVTAAPSAKQKASDPVQLYIVDPRSGGATTIPVLLYAAPEGSVGTPVFVP